MQIDYRRVTRVALYVVTIALVGNAARLLMDKPTAQNRQITSHTVILAETIIDRNGHGKPGPMQTWAVRSDGSTYSWVHEVPSVETLTFASGIKVLKHATGKTKSTMQIRPQPERWLRDPPSRCVDALAGGPFSSGEKIVGEETLAGYRAVKISRGRTTLWYAVDAGCALVKSVLDFGSEGRSESNLISLSLGEPSAELFLVPSDFREGPPSALLPLPANCDAGCAEQRKRSGEARDREYFANQVRR